jgi:hypothetical protein
MGAVDDRSDSGTTRRQQMGKRSPWKASVLVWLVVAIVVAGCGKWKWTEAGPAPTPTPTPGAPVEGLPFIVMGGADDNELIDIFVNSAPLGTPTATFTPTPGGAGAVLAGDFVQIGVNTLGQLMPPIVGAGPAVDRNQLGVPAADVRIAALRDWQPIGVTTPPATKIGFARRTNTGVRSEPDVILPGCECEGWGVRFDTPGRSFFGGANNNLGGATGTDRPTLVSIETATQGTMYMVRTVVDVGPLRITQIVWVRQGDRYAGFDITLTNTGTAPITNLRYVRTMDFDIDASAGGSFTSDRWKILQVGGMNAIVRGRGTIRNLKHYAVATRSPFLIITDGRTFPDTVDPNNFANNDPNDGAGDFGSSVVFRVDTIAPGASVKL